LAEKKPVQSLKEVMASLRIEFIERANDHLDELDAAIRSAQHNTAGKFLDEYEFRRAVHSLKGSGGTFGFPLITVIAHRLEDYMSEMEGSGQKALEGIQIFVDRMRDNIDVQEGSEPDAAAKIARSLPIAGIADFDVVKVDIEVMLISPKDTASRIISKELQECGFRVINVPSPFVTLEKSP
jgi:chemotaxis protein histidine kinase CheA